MTKVLMVAATLVFALSLAAPVDASCGALARIRTTNAAGQTSFITNTAFQNFPVIPGVTYAGTYNYGPITYSNDPLFPAIPPLTAAANISFWRTGTGDRSIQLLGRT